METTFGKLGWRANLVLSKLGGKCPDVPWDLLWRWISQRHVGGKASVTVLEQDPARNMVRLQVGDHQLWYPAEASTELLGIFYPEVFDPNNAHFYEYAGARLKPGDVALDAGACEGYFVRYALERGANVLVVEPWSRMVEALEYTYAKEIAEGRVEIFRAFLGVGGGTGTLTVDLDHPFSSGAGPHGASSRTLTETAPILTLDEVVAASKFGRVDFLKMDIEGGERDALAGAAETVRKHRPRLSITTYHRTDDWRYLPDVIRGYVKDYKFTHKGVVYYPGGWRPMLVHGWTE